MDIFKNQKTIIVLEIVIFSIFAFFIGSAQTVSPFYGDLNLLDEGQFAAWANQMLHGQHIFKDMYIVYGPLFVYPLYLFFKYISTTAFIIRVYFSLGAIVGILVINIFMKELKLHFFSRLIMNILLILLPLLSFRQALGFIAIYFSFLALRKNNRLFSVLTGLSIALAFLTSPEIGIFVGLIIAFYYLLNLKSLNIKTISLTFTGFILPLLIFSVWSGYEGWLVPYISNTLNVLRDFKGINVPNGQGLPDIFASIPVNDNVFSWIKFLLSKDIFIYITILINVFLLMHIFVKVILKKDNQTDNWLAIFLLYGLFFMYLFIGRPDFPHFIFGLSPILLTMAYYLDRNIPRIRSTPYLIIVLLTLFYFVRVLYINNPQIKKIAMIPAAITSQKDNPKYVGPILISDNQKKYFSGLQKFINANSTNKDKIFIFSDEPMLYLILDRDNATKYALPYAANLKSMREDMIKDLKTNKPTLVLVDKNAWSVDGINNFIRLPEVGRYIYKNYQIIETIDGVKILKDIQK